MFAHHRQLIAPMVGETVHKYCCYSSAFIFSYQAVFTAVLKEKCHQWHTQENTNVFIRQLTEISFHLFTDSSSFSCCLKVLFSSVKSCHNTINKRLIKDKMVHKQFHYVDCCANSSNLCTILLKLEMVLHLLQRCFRVSSLCIFRDIASPVTCVFFRERWHW